MFVFRVFLNAYLPCGFELAIELSYPLPESTVTGLLVAISQLIGVGLTTALSEIMERFGSFYSLLVQVIVLAVGSIVTMTIPNRMRRQEAFKKNIAFEKLSAEEETPF